MHNFINKFKQTSFYDELFNIKEDIAFIYIGGSRCFNTYNDFSDYDINIVTIDGDFKDLFFKYYLTYENKKVHCYYRPIREFFSSRCLNNYHYSGILTLQGISEDIIIYKNPKYAKVIDKLCDLKQYILPPVCYELFNFNKDYLSELLDTEGFMLSQSNKTLYFLGLASYCLFNEPLELDFLKALNSRRTKGILTEEHKLKLLERLKRCTTFIKEHPIDTSKTLDNLYTQLKHEVLENLEEDYVSV